MWESSSLNMYEPTFEWYANNTVHKIVLALVTKRTGYNTTIGRAWINKLQFKSVDLLGQECIDGSLIDQELDFEEASDYERNIKNELAHDSFETMVKQIVCAFVHQTSWVGRLRRFYQTAEVWLKSTTCLGVAFFMSDGIQDFVRDWAEHDWDLEAEIQGFEWWKGFDESKTERSNLFTTTLEYITRRLSSLIQGLDAVFDKSPSNSLEIDLSCRGWEIIALEWIREEEETAYIFYYGTAGELFYFQNYVLAERRKRSDEFMELRTRERFNCV